MANYQTSYPYPVLGHADDFQKGVFEIEKAKDPLISDNSTLIQFSINISHTTLEGLIKAGKAMLVTEVSCKEAHYKKLISYDIPTCEIKVSSRDLRGRVAVKTWIVAKDNILEYKPEGLHSDYSLNSFRIEKGDILAEAKGFWFIADKEFDAKNAPTGSFIEIAPGSESQGCVEVDYKGAGGKIIISLPADDINYYQLVAADPDVKKILHANIVLPVLMQGVVGVIDGESSDWFNERLSAVFEKNPEKGKLLEEHDQQNIDLFHIAQSLLEDPLSGSYPISRSLVGAHAKLIEPRDPEGDEGE